MAKIFIADKPTLDLTKADTTEIRIGVDEILDILSKNISNKYDENLMFGSFNVLANTWYTLADISGGGRLITSLITGDGRTCVMEVTLKDTGEVLYFRSTQDTAIGITRQDYAYIRGSNITNVHIGEGVLTPPIQSRSSYPQPTGTTETNALAVLLLDKDIVFDTGITIRVKATGGNDTIFYSLRIQMFVE